MLSPGLYVPRRMVSGKLFKAQRPSPTLRLSTNPQSDGKVFLKSRISVLNQPEGSQPKIRKKDIGKSAKDESKNQRNPWPQKISSGPPISPKLTDCSCPPSSRLPNEPLPPEKFAFAPRPIVSGPFSSVCCSKVFVYLWAFCGKRHQEWRLLHQYAPTVLSAIRQLPQFLS